MPVERQSITHKFSLGGHEGYITAGMYEDGEVGEIFLTDIGKEGSTIKGLMNAFATAVSIGLQYGVPLETLVEKFAYVRFEPEGITKNPEIPFAKSLPDYIMRWLASRFLDADYQEELGILTPEVRARKEAQQTLFVNEGPAPMSAGAEGEDGGAAEPKNGVANGALGRPDRGSHRHAPGPPGPHARPGARPGMRPVRRHDAAHGLVLHVLELRQQHRLRLSRPRRSRHEGRPGRPSSFGSDPQGRAVLRALERRLLVLLLGLRVGGYVLQGDAIELSENNAATQLA